MSTRITASETTRALPMVYSVELHLDTGSDRLIREIWREVAEMGGFKTGAWAELNSRTLSPKQHRRLLEGLVDKQRRGDHFSPDDWCWIAARTKAGEIPEALADEYDAINARRPEWIR